ncbi:MAG TPA: TIGR01777 family oxidoreductase [Chryseolinea sp.]|nr:TIGR01777 family oxidoreductase [Chryseolinea sp.]HPM30435.1 TIGR01777 family oxidoreductase [Chryseolinea sp.]
MKKIVIAGGTGFLGNCLVDHFRGKNAQIIILTRGESRTSEAIQYANWDGKTFGSWVNTLEDADVLINLNGKSVDCRYTEKNKKLIYSTRLDATNILGHAIQQSRNPPKLWINAASATIYRHSIDKEMDEYTGEIGTGFSVDVCQKWENTFNRFETSQTRKILIRTGIVLGKIGGPLKPLKMLAKFGLGGKHGSGDQYFSWLHDKDFVNIIQFLIDNPDAEGEYNVTAPKPVVNSQIMKALRSAIGISFGLPQPKWLLEFGALLIGTETELILKSRRVIPKRLLEAGYKFQFDNIEKAMIDLAA